MAIRLGIIADDFTGATDIASFIAQADWRVVQVNGIPAQDIDLDGIDAVVISLKSRSCPAGEAVALSRDAAQWFKSHGNPRIYFKYCSTFDSTPAGNIGPVTDMLLDETGTSMAVLCPALPVNGRTVVYGHLFVKGELLNESGMQNHPLTPMTDANLMRVMEQQSTGSCGLVALASVRAGSQAVIEQLRALQQAGKRYAVLDAMDHDDLAILAQSLPDDLLLTGGSGLAGAIAALAPAANDAKSEAAPETEGAAVVLSGSCSVMTNQQVAVYRQHAASHEIDIERALRDSSEYLPELVAWYQAQAASPAPLFYATRPAAEVKKIQARFGVEATGAAIENLLASLAEALQRQGVNKFIVAGGETSSLIVQRLNVSAFAIGDTITPGVPWVKDVRRGLWLALKSGNFGDENFFLTAQEVYK